MADITKLRSKADKGAPPMPEPSKTSKGAPPPREQTNDNLSKPPRGKPVAKAKIEFSVPKYMLDEFAQEAGKRFGFKKGSKSDLFIAMWDEYKSLKS